MNIKWTQNQQCKRFCLRIKRETLWWRKIRVSVPLKKCGLLWALAAKTSHADNKHCLSSNFFLFSTEYHQRSIIISHFEFKHLTNIKPFEKHVFVSHSGVQLYSMKKKTEKKVIGKVHLQRIIYVALYCQYLVCFFIFHSAQSIWRNSF